MTTGKPMPLIVGFAVPLLIGGVFQQVYNLVDVMIVGRYLGEQALAGVGSTGSLTFFMLSLVMGLCNGAGILVAQCFGVGNFSDMRRAVTSIIWIAGILTTVVMLIGVFACPFFLRLLSVPEDVIDYSVTYMRILLLFTGGSVAYNGASAVLRSLGDSKTPLTALIIASVINILLDLLLIVVIPLKVAGAAIATVTAQGIVMSVMIIGIFVQKKDNVLKGIRLFARIPMEYVSGICKIGIPTALQGMAYCVISMVLARMVSVFGAEAVAVQRVGGQIESLSWNTADGFAAALNAFVGQNYGANKMDRVKKGYRASLWTVGIWGLIITAIFVFVPKPIARIFFHEATAIEIAVDYLIIVGLSEAFMCVELMTVGALSGLGKTHLCSVISIIFTGARIPLAILLCRTALGLNGIWCAVSSTSIVKGIIFVATFFWITRSSRILKNNSRL